MPDTTYIFNPKESTLAERIRAYLKVCNDFRRVKFGIEQADNKNWSDTLGSSEEIKQAYGITETSLEFAISSIKQSELEQAKKEGLMNDKELIELITLKRKQEVKAMRKEHVPSHSKGHTPNR